jgi:hypothetical protein
MEFHMAPRTRNYNFNESKGRIVTGGVLVAGGGEIWASLGTCVDQTGPGDCAPFGVTKKKVSGGRVNVFNDANNYWDNYRVDYTNFDAAFDHLGPPFGEARLDADLATQAAARTNPSRPYVDVVENVLQLGELTKLIQNRGNSMIREAGRENLRYQFGIAPLVGDLVKLSQFENQLARRVGEIQRLQSAKGLRRTIDLGAWSNTDSYSAVMQSNQYFWTDLLTRTTSQRISAFLTWLPEGDLSGLGMHETLRLAMRSVLGLTIDAKTLWEVLPWSWLIDWGSNVGNFFAANRNIIPATLSGVHIMRETQTRILGRGVSFGANGAMSPVYAEVTSKSRQPSFIAPVAHFPILSGNQMGILASLAVTRL